MASGHQFRSRRTRKGRPRVERFFVRDDDGSRISYEDARAVEATGVALQVRELHLISNGQLIWSEDVDGVAGAYARICDQMMQQATDLGVADFGGLVKALRQELAWSEPEARVLAVRFVFPWSLQSRRLHAVWRESKRRGRPTIVDRTTLRVRELANAWLEVTGTSPSPSESGLFKAAVQASAPFLGLSRDRRGTITLMNRFLRREMEKLRSPSFRWVPPSGLIDDDPS